MLGSELITYNPPLLSLYFFFGKPLLSLSLQASFPLSPAPSLILPSTPTPRLPQQRLTPLPPSLSLYITTKSKSLYNSAPWFLLWTLNTSRPIKWTIQSWNRTVQVPFCLTWGMTREDLDSKWHPKKYPNTIFIIPVNVHTCLLIIQLCMNNVTLFKFIDIYGIHVTW